MNCQDFENNVNDLAREQTMEATIRASALTHGDECEACGQRLKDELALSFRLSSLAADMKSGEAPPLDNKLLFAFRNHQRTANRPIGQGRWRYWMAAAAAVVLLVIGITVMRARLTTPTIQSLPSPASQHVPLHETAIGNRPASVAGLTPAASPSVNPALMSPGVVKIAGSKPQRNLSRLLATSQATPGHGSKDVATTATTAAAAFGGAESGPTEVATDFMPVGYASAMEIKDGGQVVRVELPRSALVAFGLPMNVNRYHEKVKADVFFGADGMARAIRFVQ